MENNHFGFLINSFNDIVVRPSPAALVSKILSEVSNIALLPLDLYFRATDKILQSVFFLSNPSGNKVMSGSSIF